MDLIDPASSFERQSRSPLGDPIGVALPDWSPRQRPQRLDLQGRYSSVEPLGARHMDRLFAAYRTDETGRMWTYMSQGPFPERDGFAAWVDQVSAEDDPLFFFLGRRADHRPVGIAALMRIVPETGCIEIGSIALTPEMKGTRESTEALYLLMRHAFDLGYRRLEWKCDALNAASRRAAHRLGFRFEGIFLNATIYKGRNRDTAWFAITDTEWPRCRDALEHWLDPSNFDAADRQRRHLSAIREASGQGE